MRAAPPEVLQMHDTISVATPKGDSMSLITDQVEKIVQKMTGFSNQIVTDALKIVLNGYLSLDTIADFLQPSKTNRFRGLLGETVDIITQTTLYFRR